ncbi:MAG TPA: hypothetical protein VK658_02890, partial [Chryseolinea sp.]|nr:hypothetical protein [Chryseolinea sp.]
MTLPSATPLAIHTEPTLINFHVAELRVAGIPKTEFNFNFYHGDPFTEYCDDTLAQVLANLLINQVVRCQTVVTIVPFLFIFKQRVSYDYYTVTTPSLTGMGRVEKSILRVLWGLSKPLPTVKLIDRVITDMVGTNERVVNPWREIFRTVVESNYPNAWTFTYRKTLLGKRLDVVLNPAL